MSVWQRLAGLWGALFPVAALVLFAVLLSFGARGTTADTAPGQTSGASQTTSQSGGTTAGGGSGGAMNSTASGTEAAGTAGTAQTTGTAPAATTSGASGTASSATTAPSSDMQSTDTNTQNSGTQDTTAQGAGSTAPTSDSSASTGAAGGAASTTDSTQTAVAAKSSAEGAQIYSANCSSCHGPSGAGVAGAFPPLAGNKAILGSEKYVSDVLLYGLQGEIAVNGQTYNGVMPAWAATLSDAQIAAVLDHVRSSWGNSASAVTEATVKTERASTMTAAQVLSERPQ